MSLSNIGKACLFSNISGVILLDGKPVENALLIRTIEFSNKKTDKTRTDSNGYFEMPAIFERSVKNILPQEFSSAQEIELVYKGQSYAIWSGVKRKPDENSESQGKPLVVKCELNSERNFIQVDNSPIFSLCTWDVIPDQIDTGF